MKTVNVGKVTKVKCININIENKSKDAKTILIRVINRSRISH